MTTNSSNQHPVSSHYYTNGGGVNHTPHTQPRATSSESHFSIPEDSLHVSRHWFISNVTVYTSKVLGRGSFGTVCLGEWLGCSVAIKKPHDVFFDRSVSETERQGILKTFAREINILFQLKHPNIVLFYGLHDSGCGPEVETLSSDTCLVQELLQCSLSARNRQTPRLTFKNAVDLSLGITGGLRYLHERHEPIVHRDLASKNVLLNQNGVPKIADLGVAKVISSSHKFIHLSRQPGTELYMPPEVKIEGMQYDSRIDIYSLGVVILEMGVGRDPTAGEAFRTAGAERGELRLVPEVERRRRDLLDLGDSPLKGLILSCLACKEERPTALGVFERLEGLKEQRYYKGQLDTPVMPVSVDQWSSYPAQMGRSQQHNWFQAMEDKVKQLEEEKEELTMKLAMGKREGGSLPNRLEGLANTYPGSVNHQPDVELTRLQKTYLERMSDQYQIDQNNVRLLEATIRSRDSEIVSLRERNIRLEQEIGDVCGTGFRNDKSPPHGLLTRGVPSSPPYTNGGHVTSNGMIESELKQVKRNLEKYKNITVELDSKLKDAKLELSKWENRQTGAHVQARYENEALRSENCLLRSEVDRLRRECGHLQSVYHHRY